MRSINMKFSRTGIILLFLLVYLLILFWTERTDFLSVILPYSIAFAGLIIMQKKKEVYSFQQWLWWGIVIRLLFLFYIPEWSDDVYRFLWDGQLLHEGINPYFFLPSELSEIQNTHPELYLKMNSAHYYSVYPPISQFVFYLSTWFDQLWINVVLMRCIIIGFEIGTFIVMRKILQHFQLPENKIWWYFLNPLVIVELTGNLHLEGIMLFFILLSIWFIVKNNKIASGVLFGLAVSTKLIPLLLLPFWLKIKGWKWTLVFYLAVGITVVLSLLPFLSQEMINKSGSSVNLYFQTFEFNAPIYYLLREIGFLITGFNTIQWVGPLLAVLVFITVIGISFKAQKQNIRSFFKWGVVALTVYYLLATTVHPWYIVTILGLSVFTTFQYPIVWSFVVVLSYFAYTQPGFQENGYVLLLEYILLAIAIISEIRGSDRWIKFLSR